MPRQGQFRNSPLEQQLADQISKNQSEPWRSPQVKYQSGVVGEAMVTDKQAFCSVGQTAFHYLT